MGPGAHWVAHLRQAGIPPKSVRHLVHTHLHIEHTRVLGHFPTRPWSSTQGSWMLRERQIHLVRIAMSAMTSNSPTSIGGPTKASWTYSVTGRCGLSRRPATHRATTHSC